MEILLVIRGEKQETRDIVIDSMPRVGEYIAMWADGGNLHDIFIVSAIVHHISDGGAVLPAVIVDKRCSNQSLPIFYRGA